ncbi:MAG: prefoldin subunit alpha [Candidatus Lokiarchaeota archaeon]|nr:prefoldin subunit alpha [Candidatus Lokiarchaeota archaeon]
MTESPDYQQLLVHAYNLQMQLQASMNELSQVENMLEGLSLTNEVIDGLNEAPPNQEIILPIGSYAYIKAKIPNPDNFLIHIGRKTVVERDSKQSLDLIRKKRDQFQKQKDTLKKIVDELTQKLKEIEPYVTQFQQQYQQQQLNLSSKDLNV